MNPIGSITALAICVALSAYFSATETAFSSLNKTRLKVLAESGNKKATKTLELSENYDQLISTILIGNNIVNIAGASIATVLFVHIYGDIGATLSTIVTTIVVLIFGEITPKSLAKDSPEEFAMFSTSFVRLLIVLLTPLNHLFSLWKKLLSKLIKPQNQNGMSHEELLILVKDVQEDGNIDKQEGELLQNAMEFRDLSAAEVLTHRVDIEAIQTNTPYEEIATIFTDSRYSRLLVYQDTIDQIVGVLHQKDFYVNGHITDKPLDFIMTKPVYVYQNVKCGNILQMLQVQKSHVAVVIDEYGGTLGIVTMEDILEELVGEIWDEHDEIKEPIKKLDDSHYQVDCSISLDDFNAFFHTKITSESISVAGWLMEYLNRIPLEGDHFSADALDITVTKLNANRVSMITVFMKA